MTSKLEDNANASCDGGVRFQIVTSGPRPAGSVLDEVNWEGTATGFGAVFGTATYVGGPKNGTFSWCSASYLDNRHGFTGISQGTMKAPGNTGGARIGLCRSPMALKQGQY